jgi:hypothetical protein
MIVNCQSSTKIADSSKSNPVLQVQGFILPILLINSTAAQDTFSPVAGGKAHVLLIVRGNLLLTTGKMTLTQDPELTKNPAISEYMATPTIIKH